MITKDWLHQKVHEGSVHTADYQESGVANNASVSLRFKATTKALHLVLGFDVSANFQLTTYADTKYTVDGTAPDGTKLTVFNRVMGGDGKTALVYYAPTADELGTKRASRLITGGTGPKSTGGTGAYRIETIIPPNHDLLCVFKCLAGDGQAGDINVTADWYEVTFPEAETDLTDVYLSAFTVKEDDGTEVTLAPTFDAEKLVYTGTVDWEEKYVKLAGVTVPTGCWTRGFGDRDLEVGDNVLYAEIYKDGYDARAYKVTLTRKDLARGETFSILNDEEELVDFDDETFAYVGSVPSTVATLAVTGTALDGDDTVSFSENVVAGEVTLTAGANTIVMTVADDKSLATNGVYTAVITKLTLLLESLTLGEDAVVLEDYDYTYAKEVANTVDSISVSATAGEDVTITWSEEVVGGVVALSVGANVFTATLSKEGEANAVYTITVTRASE